MPNALRMRDNIEDHPAGLWREGKCSLTFSISQDCGKTLGNPPEFKEKKSSNAWLFIPLLFFDLIHDVIRL